MTSGQHRAIPQSQHQQSHGNRADQALVVRIRDAPGEPASKTGIEEYKATRIEFNNWDALKHDHNKKKYHYISLIVGPWDCPGIFFIEHKFWKTHISSY